MSENYKKNNFALSNHAPVGYYIAYFDILGYKYLVHNDHWFMLLMRILKSKISWLNDSVKEPHKESDSPSIVKYKVFSDNILICSKENWVGVFNKAVILQKDLMKEGVFIRGGMCYGNLYFDENFVGGQGLIKAVDLEGEAKFPRIIIDETFVGKINTTVTEAFGANVCHDKTDDKLFIDYLSHDYEVCQYYQGQWIEFSALLINHQARIKWNIANCHKNIELHKNDEELVKLWQGVLQKYEWCKSYHNNFWNKHSDELSKRWKNADLISGLLI